MKILIRLPKLSRIFPDIPNLPKVLREISKEVLERIRTYDHSEEMGRVDPEDTTWAEIEEQARICRTPPPGATWKGEL